MTAVFVRLLLAVCALAAALSGPAHAQALSRDLPTTSYITPFPKGDIYSLHVVGDSLSVGLHRALRELMKDEARVRVAPGSTETKSLTSSLWDRTIRSIENGTPPAPLHITVVMLGTYDRASLRRPGARRIPLGSEAWSKGYAQRISRFMRALKKRKTAVYWVSLPVMRSGGANSHARRINEIIREQALRSGIKFINIYETFADENGQYTPYGPDLEGKVRSLRYKDGIHFTSAGYEKIAHFVKREILRDLRQAQAERLVELRGSPAELKRIRPKPDAKPAMTSTWSSLITGRSTQSKTKKTPGAPGTSSDRGLKAETVTVKVSPPSPANGKAAPVEIKIFRPAVAPTIVALVTRRSSPERPVRFGDDFSLSAPSGRMLGTVSPSSSSNFAIVRKKMAPTQMPFFKVWAKGERLAPRENRADDFSWPRPHPVVLIDPPKPDPPKIEKAAAPKAPTLVRRSYLPPGWTGPPLPEIHPLRR